MQLKKVGLFVGLSLFSLQTMAIWDAGSWNTLDITYQLNKKWNVVFTQECRLKYNYSQLNLFYTNIGMERIINSSIKTSLVYRHIDKYLVEGGGFSYRHRIMWDASYKYRFTNKASITYRHRLQVENRNILSSEIGRLLEYYSRSKFSFKYALSPKVSSVVAAEFRYQLHDPRSLESEKKWHRDRYQAGVEYEWSNFISTEVYYLIQREYNVSIPENLSILGLGVSLTIDNNAKKKVSHRKEVE